MYVLALIPKSMYAYVELYPWAQFSEIVVRALERQTHRTSNLPDQGYVKENTQ